MPEAKTQEGQAIVRTTEEQFDKITEHLIELKVNLNKLTQRDFGEEYSQIKQIAEARATQVESFREFLKVKKIEKDYYKWVQERKDDVPGEDKSVTQN